MDGPQYRLSPVLAVCHRQYVSNPAAAGAPATVELPCSCHLPAMAVAYPASSKRSAMVYCPGSRTPKSA